MRFTWRDKVRYRDAIPTRLPLGLGLLLAKTAPMLGSLNRGQSGQQMDHLPQVLDPVRSPVDVPFVRAGFSLDLNPSSLKTSKVFLTNTDITRTWYKVCRVSKP